MNSFDVFFIKGFTVSSILLYLPVLIFSILFYLPVLISSILLYLAVLISSILLYLAVLNLISRIFVINDPLGYGC